jgi:ceramide synthetase
MLPLMPLPPLPWAEMPGVLFKRHFWFYPETVAPRAGAVYPTAAQLLEAVLWALVLTGVRMVLNMLVLNPILRRLFGADLAPSQKLQLLSRDQQRAVQAAAAASATPTAKAASELAPKLGVSVADAAQLVRDVRRRQARQRTAAKFRESGFRLFYYACVAVFGVTVMANKPFVRETAKCWTDFPSPLDGAVRLYYFVSLGYYLHALVAMFYEERKKDFAEMLLHHVVTVFLIAFSWIVNFDRVGTLVLLVHDVADPFLEAAKLFNYAAVQWACDSCFVIFALTFAVTRLYVFPRYVIYSTMYESYNEAIGLMPLGSWYFFNALLLILLVLHMYWFFLIVRMVYRFVIVGKVEKDARSEAELSDGDAQQPAKSIMAEQDAADAAADADAAAAAAVAAAAAPAANGVRQRRPPRDK